MIKQYYLHTLSDKLSAEAIQFFESLFASRCRKLYSIVNSVVVLNEAQLLPPEFLNPILYALDELRKHYGVTLLLFTATQPALSPQKSKTFTFEEISDTKEIKREILRYGAQVEVVSPAALRNEIKKEIQNMKKVYR
jgi:CRISPR/Cas system-associated endonuclease/helicase Cas3